MNKNMEQGNSITIREKYKELIAYICNMGTDIEILYETQVEITIKVLGYSKKELIVVHLFQPINKECAYNYHRLRVSWRIPSESCLTHDHWFKEDTDQREIFDLMLLDIVEYKFNTIKEETIDNSNILIYMVLKDLITEKKELSTNEECQTPPSKVSYLGKIKMKLCKIFKIK